MEVCGFNDSAACEFFLCSGETTTRVLWNNKVFVGRFDDSMVALNAETRKSGLAGHRGKLPRQVSINSAPQFVHPGTATWSVISLSGGEYEIRGQVFCAGR